MSTTRHKVNLEPLYKGLNNFFSPPPPVKLIGKVTHPSTLAPISSQFYNTIGHIKTWHKVKPTYNLLFLSMLLYR